MSPELEQRLACFEQRLSEVEYKQKAIDPEELKAVLDLMRDYRIQRLNYGSLMVEAQWNHGMGSQPHQPF